LAKLRTAVTDKRHDAGFSIHSIAFKKTLNMFLTMGAVDSSLSGVAGSMNSLARTIGLTIGISFSATLLSAQLPDVKRISPQSGEPFLHALATVFWLATLVSVVGLVIVVFRSIRSHKNGKVLTNNK
jgi:uncharacterized membrane protein (UPF0136 family)